jgi:hypothetical protein
MTPHNVQAFEFLSPSAFGRGLARGPVCNKLRTLR